MHTFAILASLLAASASLAAAGTATVNNYCNFNVVVTRDSKSTTLGANGGKYTETIAGSAAAIKLTRDGNVYGGNENELDYSLATGQYGGLYWSIGQNGTPFKAGGYEVLATGGGKVVCAAGQGACSSGTQYAAVGASLTMNLCKTS